MFNRRKPLCASTVCALSATFRLDLTPLDGIIAGYKGDYYILASGVDEGYDKVLAVYEFFIPEEKRGMLMAFRPANCYTEDGLFVLKGLDPTATYEVTVVDNGQTLTLSGEKLMTTGLAINFPTSNLSLIIYINEV